MKSNLLVRGARPRVALIVVVFVVSAALSHAASGAAGPDSTALSRAVAVDSAAGPRAVSGAPDSTSLNVRAFRLLNGAAENRVFDAVMPVATDFSTWRYVVILIWCALVVFGKTKGRWAALMLIPIIAASDQLASSVMKPLFQRVRPCEVLGNVHLWLDTQGWMTTPARVTMSYKNSLSFPSSHAANITASMLFLGLVYRRWLAPLCAVALVVSYSRIYTGVHWPSDVLGGMLVGAAIAALAYALFRRLLPSAHRAGRNGRDAEDDETTAAEDSPSHDSTK